MKNKYILLIFSAFVLNAGAQTFTGKPQYQILTKRNNVVLGSFTVELWPTITPKHARNFDSLVSTGFYDSTAFHRVIPGFVIQGGDPNSRSGPESTWGFGQPGQPTVPAEFTSIKHVRGTLSAARKANDINSATSQFFICVATATNLNGAYSAFGKVVSGMVVVDTIVKQPTVGTTNRPVQKIEMFITKIASNDSLPNKPVLLNPANNTVGLDSNVSFQLKWNAVSNAMMYRLEVSTDSMFVNDTIRSVNLMNTIYLMNNLKGNTRYYWRVKSNNGGRYNDSERWNFHTSGETTNIKNVSASQVFNVFPNPGTGLFTFENIIPGSSIEILDISGKIILKEQVSNAKVEIDLRKKDKGLYFYQVTAGSAIIEKGQLIVQ